MVPSRNLSWLAVASIAILFASGFTCGVVPSCTSDCDCPLSNRCESGSCQAQVVFGPTSGACWSDCQCAANESCTSQSGSQGECKPVASCTSDCDCPLSHRCESGSCQAQAVFGPSSGACW